MIDWVLGSNWLLIAVLIVGGFALYGVLGFAFTRRVILPRIGLVSHQNEVTSTLVHGILVIYGLAVALLAIAVWENNAEVTRIVSNEAVAIAGAYRDAGSYPEPVRTQLRSDLKAYTEQILTYAWPLMRKGQVPTGGVAAMDTIQADLFTFEPATDGQRALHQEMLHAFNELNHARRLRLDAVATGLPAPMWVVVLLGAFITISATFFFDVANVRLHRLMILQLSTIMGLLIFLIAFYDRPFRGSHGIKPEAYELIHKQLMEH